MSCWDLRYGRQMAPPFAATSAVPPHTNKSISRWWWWWWQKLQWQLLVLSSYLGLVYSLVLCLIFETCSICYHEHFAANCPLPRWMGRGWMRDVYRWCVQQLLHIVINFLMIEGGNALLLLLVGMFFLMRVLISAVGLSYLKCRWYC